MKTIKYFILVLILSTSALYIGCESNDATTNSVYIPQPVNKKVLVEFFTNAGCNPCIVAHNFLDQVMENTGVTINDTSVIILSYHTRYPFSGDSLYRMNVAQNEYRSTTFYGVNFTPQGRINGTTSGQFSSSNWAAQMNSEMNSTKYLDFSLSNTYDAGTRTGSITANISLASALPSSDNVIHMVISENHVSYITSPNGIKYPNDVMRYMITTEQGESVTIGQNTAVTKSFTIDPKWKAEDCYINVFVQSVSTKEIFGVERIKIVP